MLTDRESLKRAAEEAFQEAELPGQLPASEAFKMGFYAGFRAAKFEEQEALLKSLETESR